MIIMAYKFKNILVHLLLGPSHWGQTAFMAIANDVWPACYQGKMQSPISISTKHLLFDPNLVPLKISGSDKQVSVSLIIYTTVNS